MVKILKYIDLSKEELIKEKEKLESDFISIKSKGLNLTMARGIPSIEQIDLSRPMLDVLKSTDDLTNETGINCASYGSLDGIPEAKRLFADIMNVEPDMVMVGGSSSLNMMFDTISAFMYKSPVEGEKPWAEVENRKFLCVVPGYDRHFAITEYFGFEMINVELTNDGPDMDKVEELVKDPSVKGMWCVPKYSNPSGVTYSDETVKRIAALKPAAKDFRIIYDNAYAIHELTDDPDVLLPLWDECKKTGNEDLAIQFCSTSKITFPGGGVAALACSENNLKYLKSKYTLQIISYDKVNMLRHVRYFGDINGVKEHMDKHKEILAPRFNLVCDKLEEQLVPYGIVSYNRPKGGYFISANVLNGTAKRVVELCKEAGVVLTGAGATYPYKKDPNNSNIRIAPTFPSTEELSSAIDVFCICARLAACEYLIEK